MEADGGKSSSAGCVEVAAKLKKKAKKLPNIERLTCLDIYRNQLTNNSRKCTENKPRPQSESQCYVRSGSKEVFNIAQEELKTTRRNLNKKNSSLWNAQEETLRRSKSEVNQTIALLNKRLEYGKQVGSTNRFQMMLSKMKKDEEAKKSISSASFSKPRSVENLPTASDQLMLEALDSCISKFCEIGIKLKQIRKGLE